MRKMHSGSNIWCWGGRGGALASPNKEVQYLLYPLRTIVPFFLVEEGRSGMQTVLEALPQEFQQFREVVETLARLVLQVRLFPATHLAVDRALGAAHAQLDAILQRKKSVKLTFSNGVVSHLNFEMDLTDVADKSMHLLREVLVRQAIGEIEFEKGVTKEEICSLALVLAAYDSRSRAAALASAGAHLTNVRVRQGEKAREPEGPTASDPRRERIEDRRQAEPKTGAASDSKMGMVVRNVLERLEKIQSPEGHRAGSKILEVVERQGGNTATILLLDSLKGYDEYTFTHSVNVAVISAAVARSIALEEEFIDAIAHAALLHDIGKLYVPREIINKTGRLTPCEWQAMKKHPIDGERILREEGLDLMARRVAYEHHMRHDLAGYPAPKSGYVVHQASEIVRIADSYDALTTRRPYRKQINPYEAIKLMVKSIGTEFHQEYLGAFFRVLGNIPIGSILRLSTGETVLVVDISGRDALPHARVLTDARGNEMEEEVILDLNERHPRTNDFIHQIEAIVEQPVRDVDIGKYIVE
jgi:putative nucleotidyltransferase with HDIG domain